MTTEQTKPRVARATIQGLSPLTQGRAFPPDLKKNHDEKDDAFDKRVWRERAHWNKDGQALIPAAALHKALIASAKFRGEKIPGQGQKTWTKRFGAGILVLANVVIEPNVSKEAIDYIDVHVPSDGTPGGTRRVYRRFPIYQEWGGSIEFTVVDGLIDEQVFLNHLTSAGKYIGLGTHRPSSNSPGPNGRFGIVGEVEWETIS